MTELETAELEVAETGVIGVGGSALETRDSTLDVWESREPNRDELTEEVEGVRSEKDGDMEE